MGLATIDPDSHKMQTLAFGADQVLQNPQVWCK